jgi:translation initiation factor IF-2
VATVLGLEVDEVFELMLDMDNTDYIRNERQPINNQEVFKQLAQKMKFRIKYVPDPRRKAAQNVTEENLDVKVIAPKAEDLVAKPPVVTIMGHVDHGKTTLLDYLRKSRIVESEFGGITQHIGAFSVSLDKTHTVTFIDTPGHAAFKAMRSRGAGATDVVVLVVDACEGVLDQTLESVRMARESGAPIVVALNKIDKAGADVEAAKQQLQEAGLQLEDFGGDVQVVPISALKGTNVPKLIEAILTLAEVMQLKADFCGPVEGVVLESKVDSGLGRVATVLVQRGTLQKVTHFFQ